MTEERTTSTQAALDIGLSTDVGRVREANEDALLAVRPDGARDGQVLVAVADGMGGHKAGEVASAMAIESMRRALDEIDASATTDALLRYGAELGNRTIWDAAAVDLDREGMGTTLVCALLTADGEAVIANVGDSRAYAYVGGASTLRTSDHTWVNEQVLAGQFTEDDARTSPFRNLLTRALGTTPTVEVDLFSGLHLEVGDALILVSDGVTGYLDEHDLSAVLREAATAQEAAERIVEEAVQRGGADNATAVVVRRRESCVR
jgi:serine/threonine protein phosphatase PrpC